MEATTAKHRVRRFGRALLGGPPRVDESDIVFDAYGSKPGVMLDVGAHHGHSLEPFATHGWQVHAFEPDPSNCRALIERHGDRPNVTVVPMAVADEPGSMPIYTSPQSTGVTSLTPFTDRHQQGAVVDVTTVSSYLSEKGINAVDFLKVDVEGFEMNVLRGVDWYVRPTTIVLEFENAKTRRLGYVWSDLADELVRRGYSTIIVSEWDPIVAYGGDHRWRRFADYPTQLADESSWGNLIATTNPRGNLDAALASARRRQRIGRLFHLK